MKKFQIMYYNRYCQEDQILYLLADNKLEAYKIASEYLNEKYHKGYDYYIDEDNEPMSGDFKLIDYYKPVFETRESLFTK